jgi:predicted DNA-binding transcriptional regulator AlpA
MIRFRSRTIPARLMRRRIIYTMKACNIQPQAPREDALLRIWDICGDRKRGIPARIPYSRSRWYEGVKEGRFPKGIKIGGISVWREADIAEWIARHSVRDDAGQ